MILLIFYFKIFIKLAKIKEKYNVFIKWVKYVFGFLTFPEF